jgi:hypothetical protein
LDAGGLWIVRGAGEVLLAGRRIAETTGNDAGYVYY